MTISKASRRLMIQALPLAIALSFGSLFVLNLLQTAVNGSDIPNNTIRPDGTIETLPKRP